MLKKFLPMFDGNMSDAAWTNAKSFAIAGSLRQRTYSKRGHQGYSARFAEMKCIQNKEIR